MPTSSAPDFVTLPSGVIVSLEAVDLLIGLERRGFTVRLEDDKVSVAPGRALTDDERAAIRRWKLHLMALVEHCERLQ
jgi:hypothetical protein